MGILNVTPDSFSDGGKYFKFEDAIHYAKELVNQGVDIIDVGGESTRPGATLISEGEELRRVIPIIKCCRDVARNVSTAQIIISIDTYKSSVARKALEAGANIINDVSGLTKDKNMVHIAREFNCSIVIMHNKGIPATKPVLSTEDSVLISEVYAWLKKQTNYAIANGVKRENIIIDPGIGFGKSPKEDLYLIKNLSKFKSLGFPILVGVSRKSFVRKLFPNCDVEAKSRELTELAIKNGADIVRLHKPY
jgi:dihydropteroate synthase